MERTDHPRLLLPRFLPLPLCSELLFVHRSCSAVGYRPGVLSTTLSHLIATNCPHLILPFLPIRDALKEKAEQFFRCQYELVIEFTGLVSWCPGSSIGWHSDDNRPYLKQRDFTAVCYLNNHDDDFEGGLFRFRDGEPSCVAPMAGDVLIYTADDRNVHAVDEVLRGERVTLTLWFSRDSSHDEDGKLITYLDGWIAKQRRYPPEFHPPLPASSSMYWSVGSGIDIRCARIRVLGGYGFFCPVDDGCDPLEKPLLLCRGDEVYQKEFMNAMHALQVVEFCHWKHPRLKSAVGDYGACGSVSTRVLVRKRIEGELEITCDGCVADELLGYCHGGDCNADFRWEEFVISEEEWEDYSRRLHGLLLASMDSWRSHQAIFLVEASLE